MLIAVYQFPGQTHKISSVMIRQSGILSSDGVAEERTLAGPLKEKHIPKSPTSRSFSNVYMLSSVQPAYRVV